MFTKSYLCGEVNEVANAWIVDGDFSCLKLFYHEPEIYLERLYKTF
jgi:hypothetical protein